MTEQLTMSPNSDEVDDGALYPFPSLTILKIHMASIPDLVNPPMVLEDEDEVEPRQETEVQSGMQLLETWLHCAPTSPTGQAS